MSTGSTSGHTTASTGPAGGQETRLGLQRLDSTVQALISQGIAESTSAVYRTGWRQYSRFCDKYSLPPLPLTESNVCLFAADVSESVGWGTIRSYLSGLRFYQITAGLPDPALASLPMLAYLLKGIRKKTPDCVRSKRLPITPDLLRKMHAVWSQGPWTFDKVMLWAACCLGFFGFMRAGEFTTTTFNTTSDAVLSVGDIGVDSRVDPKVLVVHLRHSKTDPFSAGVRLFLGRTGDVLCPVLAVLRYLALRSSEPGPLFIFNDGSPLSRTLLVTHLREALSKAGVDAKSYSGHSFIIGAASAAARAGLSDSLIQTLGRWKSSAFMAYIRTPVDDLVAVSGKLVR